MHRLIRKVLAPACASAILGLLALNAVATATTATWIDRDSTPPSGAYYNDVAYGLGKFVAITDTWSSTPSAITRSQTGETWSTQTTPFTGRNWYRVTSGGTSGNERFVSVETGGDKVMWSNDGETWNIVTAHSAYWEGVAYGNGVFVAVSQGNVMTSSDNGLTWTLVTLQGDWRGLTFGGSSSGGVFVAVGSSGSDKVATSPDGLNWTIARSPASGTDPRWQSVTHGVVNGSSRFVAVANEGNCTLPTSDPCTSPVMYSDDNGATWTKVSATGNPAPASAALGGCWNDVAFGLVNGVNKFVAVGNCSANRVISSVDGVNWQAESGIPNGTWYSVTYGNGVWVAVGYGVSRIMSLGQPLPPPAPSVPSTDPAPADPAPSQDNQTDSGSDPAPEQPSATGGTTQTSAASQAVATDTPTTLPPPSTTVPVAVESSVASVVVSRAAPKARDLPSTGTQTSSLPAIVAVMLAGFMILGVRRRGREACSGDARTLPRARRGNT